MFASAPLLACVSVCTARALAQPVREVPFPHPVISEVLGDVPDGADPNQDGASNTVGDEYIEIVNPHDQPIDIVGYTLADTKGAASPTGGGGVRFIFPSVILQPGQTALLFNGFLAHIPGPVGTSDRAPSRPNDRFNGAWVFTVDNKSGTCAFSDAADVCVLVSNEGKPIDLVAWGPREPPPPKDIYRAAYFKGLNAMSVQRTAPNEKFVPHKEIDGRAFSPGRIPKPAANPAAKPDAAPPTEPRHDPLLPRARPKKDAAPAPAPAPAPNPG